MFKTLDIIEKNIRRNTRTTRLTTIVAILAISVQAIYNQINNYRRDKTLFGIDNNGNAIVFHQIDENRQAEARNHYITFHQLFFTLMPDGEQIQHTTTLARRLADESVTPYYNTYVEKHFYSKIIAASLCQSITVDSVYVSPDPPYKVALWGKTRLVGKNIIDVKELQTTAELQKIKRTKDNPHGFIIENFKIIVHRSIKTSYK